MTEQTQPTDALAKLRHLYANMLNGGVRDTASAKRIAEGLLSPAIEALEKLGTPAGAGGPVARIDARPAPRQEAQKPFCWACWIGEDSDPRRAQYSPVEPLAYSNRKPLYTTPQPTQAQAGAVPLTKKELADRSKIGAIRTDERDNVVMRLAEYRNQMEGRFERGWREAEKHYGIKGADHA